MFRDFATWLQSTSVSVTIQSVDWIIPLMQSIHIVTIGIVFVSILMVALRIVGAAQADQPYAAVVQRFSPWIGYGLIVLTVTGVTLVVGEPVREFTALSFWLKMGLLAIGVASAVAFRRSLMSGEAVLGAQPEFSRGMKSAAVGTVLLWVCIIYLGRAIAYDVEMWGSYSLAAGG